MTDIVKFDYGKLDKLSTIQRSVLKIKSVEQALELRKEMPSLVTIKLDKGEEKASAYIELLILKLNDFFNVKEKMTPEQIQETAMLILEEYYYLSFLEVIFVFKEARLGKYGDIKFSIDGGLILKWFEKYAIERARAAVTKSENERLANKFGGNESERVSTSKDFIKISEATKRFKNEK